MDSRSLYGFALVLVRGHPSATSDQGIVLSVAGRMLDGDALYAEVGEIKDPLVFYAAAGAMWVGGWRGPFLLEGLWLAVAGSAFALLLRELRLPRAAVVTGFLVLPARARRGVVLRRADDARRARVRAARPAGSGCGGAIWPRASCWAW